MKKICEITNQMIISGCQINYAIKTDTKPSLNKPVVWSIDGGVYKEADAPSRIYIIE